jgi:hypothetical protein
VLNFKHELEGEPVCPFPSSPFCALGRVQITFGACSVWKLKQESVRNSGIFNWKFFAGVEVFGAV